MPRAVVLGCAGPALSVPERRFFAEVDPLGFILFRRNCHDPEQIRALVHSLRECVGREDAPVLIDQEGGRVARLVPPQWRAAPAAADFGHLAEDDPNAGVRAAWLNARLLARDLAALGITVDCAPVLDLRRRETHDVIGDRAFGAAPATVAALGRASCDGFLSGGVLPVVKHLPGHGRAGVDSHVALPVVSASRQELEDSDFAPFRALSDAPWGMTAHVVFSEIDPDAPATLSPRIMSDIVRGSIGFKGVVISDDLSMKALSGDLRSRAERALTAGCDLVLHCNGTMDEMAAVAEGTKVLAGAERARVERAEGRRKAAFDGDVRSDSMREELDGLLRRL